MNGSGALVNQSLSLQKRKHLSSFLCFQIKSPCAEQLVLNHELLQFPMLTLPGNVDWSFLSILHILFQPKNPHARLLDQRLKIWAIFESLLKLWIPVPISRCSDLMFCGMPREGISIWLLLLLLLLFPSNTNMD